jgi:hypothetical protein
MSLDRSKLISRLARIDAKIELYEEGACDLGEQDDIDSRLEELRDLRGTIEGSIRRQGIYDWMESRRDRRRTRHDAI